MRNNQYTFKSVKDRLLSHATLDPETGCLLWSGFLDEEGYGRFTITRDGVQFTEGVHRAAWRLFKGDIPDGLELDHKCRVRHCVNIDHLEPVTHLENCRRGTAGAVNAARQRAKTHCPQGHEYTPGNTRIYNGSRHCVACSSHSTGVGKGAKNKEKTHCKYGHEYTPENTRIWRGSRYCIACCREHDRQRRKNGMNPRPRQLPRAARDNGVTA